MYTNTHVYFTKKKLNKLPSELTVVGSFLPDIALMKIIGWEDLHNKETIGKFQDYIGKTKPEFADLGKGIFYHFLLDEITHKRYKSSIGYAYQCITPKLVTFVSRSFSMKDELTSKTIAHHIIEIAVDSFVVEENPNLLKSVTSAVENADVEQIAQLLSLFFSLDKQITKSALDSFFSLMIKYDTRSMDDCINLCDDVNLLLFNTPINQDPTKQALILARELVNDSYQEFLNFSISR